MGIRQKIFTLAGIAGVIMAIVSAAGYYFASSHLSRSVEQEITSTMQGSANKLDGWLMAKKQVAVSAADLMAKQDDGTKSPEQLQALLAVAGEDANSVSDLVVGNSDGTITGYRAGNLAPKLNPLTMRFYNEPKASNQVEFMDTYVDKITGKLVVSIAAPYYSPSGAYRGAICEDIFLDVLAEEVKELKYENEGIGYIIDNTGNIIATEDTEALNKNAADVPGFSQEYQRMMEKKQGFAQVEKNGEDMILAYATVPTTSWLVGILVPEDIIYSQLQSLKLTYGILTLVGILLIVWACLQFATGIIRRILELKEQAGELAEGNLTHGDLMGLEADELGDLGRGFNVMKQNLRKLITQMSDTSEQVAASSEELTASAHQSADAATNVAQTVSGVADGMAEQTEHVRDASQNVQRVVDELSGVAEKTQQGQKLMEQAVSRMGNIENRVGDSAAVVARLGQNSQEIGAIIDTISGIAEQTNLLALNAAIEAARAGEQGRGFSVVADEVRKLAEQSQAATEEIRQRIGAVQKGTDEAVSTMQAGTDEVKNGAEAIRAVGDEFHSIMERVTSIKAQMTQIDAAVQAVSAGGGQIEDAVKRIDQVSRRTAEETETISAATEEQSASNQEIAAASQSLANMATNLQNMAAKFRI